MRLAACQHLVRRIVPLGLALCAGVSGGLLPCGVQAQGLPEYQIYCGSWVEPPATMMVNDPQFAAIGERLTGWMRVGRNSECSGFMEYDINDIDSLIPKITRLYTDHLKLRLPFESRLAGLSVMDGGEAHTVYGFRDEDGNDFEGVGYILKARHYANNTPGAWSALNLVPGVDHTGIGYDWSFAYSPPVLEIPDWPVFEMEYQIALVKTGEVAAWPPNPPWAYLYFNFLEEYIPVTIETDNPGLVFPPEEDVMILDIYLDYFPDGEGGGGGGNLPPPGGSEVIIPICNPRTPGMRYVMLETASLADFDVVGSTVKDTYFSMFWDCTSEAIELMEYQFLISSGKPSPDAAQGVLPQERPAGAQGVGIQVLEDYNSSSPVFIPSGTYQPIEFGVVKQLSPISTTPGAGGFELPLMARYYQTGPDMTAGSVEAGLTIVVTIY